MSQNYQATELNTEDLIKNNLGLVKKIAWHLHGRVRGALEIEDLIQIGYTGLVIAANNFVQKEGIPFASYASIRIRGAIIDFFRKNSKMPITGRSSNLSEDFNIFDLIKLEEKSAEDVMVNEQITKDVRLLIEELPEEQMEVVKMRYFLQMSFKDIADKTGVSINTSLGRMRYALINLRKLVTDKNLILTNS